MRRSYQASSDYRATEAGLSATYLSAADQERAQRKERQAAALRWLDQRGLDDIAVILGLRPEACRRCGADATRMGYCDAPDCDAQRRAEARATSRRAYDKARGASR